MRQVALVAVLCALAAATAQATRLRPLSLTETRDSAAAILIVDVQSASARAGEAGMIWTDYEVRLAEVLRGPGRSGDRRVLSFAGGAVGRVERGIAGVPRLIVGRRYLIFLDDAQRRAVPAVGWGEGIFEVPRNPGGEIVSLAGSPLEVDAEGRIERRSGGAHGEDRLRLPEPVGFNADGSIVPTPDAVFVSATRASRRATISDLRRFVVGLTRERER